ncbi:MBL fold metallo-hydrolase [Varunaivibrio sulfuroxidans]|uniref:Phosphoribosyl 1,2-cyclic phosphodiesterase n=1 Tax=Varunaivibrio sulfuroxidans TaxID=1773489 RepID=A0A4R3J7G5_9PROT|nr:MBL fold metallo-hydrolase [Varunaivibrio sulfuroxidans]TCS61352.1 phosphoribosyl 1,2-cyclic phosphodiesterase [Varunaivibrio sulfuroxidans]WES31035.1 MBL fold metallo-hydrolase [Varunaivibrio sulfuroxidans]
MSIVIRFWGVRGSIACPSSDHIRYGGNTSCVEVQAGGHCFVLDAGTGIRGLGQVLVKNKVQDIHLLMTHTHWDHINGFPFFTPAYDPKCTIDILAGHLQSKTGIQNVLAAQMDNPMFPVPLEAMQATLRFRDFIAGEVFQPYPGVEVATAPLRHPNGATAYRINHEGRSVCYVTDTEHVPGELDQTIVGLIKEADLVIYDCTYTEEEFPAKVGWGHSTWNQGVKLCRAAKAKKMVIFHHDPEHDDAFMDKLEAEAKEVWPSVIAAREGMVVVLDKE